MVADSKLLMQASLPRKNLLTIGVNPYVQAKVSIYDACMTDERCRLIDRDRIVCAAHLRAEQMKSVAQSLDDMVNKRYWTEPERVLLIAAAAHLRQLAES